MKTQINENSAELAVAGSSSNVALTYGKDSSHRTFYTYYPWFVISLCALFLVYKYVLQVSPSVMTTQLMSEFKVSGVGLGNLAATYFYAYLVTQIFVGPLLDRYSPRVLTFFAILICAGGAFAFANTDSLLAAGIARALMGAGTAFATVSYMKMSAIWFKPNKVAFVDGLLATAAMMGALCGQVPLTLLVSSAGWRGSLFYCGIFGVIFAFMFLIFVRDKNRYNTNSLQKADSTLKLSDIYALFKDKKNWLLTFYSGLAFTPIAVLGGLWGNPYFEVAHHLSSTQAAYFTSLIFLGLAIGGPLFGFFAGRLGDSVRVMMIGTALAFVALIFAIYVVSLPLWLFGTALFLFGLGTGVFMLCFPLGKSINHIRMAATVVALINTGDALFGSFTEPLIGRVLDFTWDGTMVNGIHHFSVANYHIALSLLPLYLLVAFGCLWKLNKMKL